MLDIVFSGLWLGLLFNAAPGAVFAESLRRGVVGGFRPALAVQIGSLAGDAVWAVLGLAGAAAVLTQPHLSIPLTLAGCAVLALLGVQGLRPSTPTLATDEPQAAPGRHGALLAGAAMSLGNVWNVVCWGGAGGAVAGSLGEGAAVESTAVFFAAFMVASIVWCFVCAGLIAGLRRAMDPRAVRAIEVASSLALLVMAIVLAVNSLAQIQG